MDLLGSLVRKGWRRGVLGGERLWLVLGAAALALQFVVRVARKKEEVVFSEKLRPGETIVITHRPPGGHNGLRESPPAQPAAGG